MGRQEVGGNSPEVEGQPLYCSAISILINIGDKISNVEIKFSQIDFIRSEMYNLKITNQQATHIKNNMVKPTGQRRTHVSSTMLGF